MESGGYWKYDIPANGTHREEEAPPDDAFIITQNIFNGKTVLFRNGNSSLVCFGETLNVIRNIVDLWFDRNFLAFGHVDSDNKEWEGGPPAREDCLNGERRRRRRRARKDKSTKLKEER
jgi:hypothetical protein